MDEQLRNIRGQLWEDPSEKELYIRELEETVGHLENLVFDILDTLPDPQRQTLEGYIYSSSELAMYTVLQAFSRGKKLGIEIGKNTHHPL